MSPKTKRTIRTILQAVVGLAAGLPLILAVSGIPATAGGVAIVLAVAGGVTRVMALPTVEGWLDAIGLGFVTPPAAPPVGTTGTPNETTTTPPAAS